MLRDHEKEVLTAAAIGLAVGVSAVLLMRANREDRHSIAPVLRAAARRGRRSARWARERGRQAWDHLTHDEVADQVREYIRDARRTLKRAVRREMRELRRTIGQHTR
jgi:hypothetical protein